MKLPTGIPAGESQVWVRVPRLASDANITAYWGNPSAGLPSYSSNGEVWDGYFGVYHLEDSTGAAKDSSSYANDLPGVNSPLVAQGWLVPPTPPLSCEEWISWTH